MTHDVFPEKTVEKGDTVWGLYQQDIPGIMTWPAEAKDRLLHKWRDANPDKDESLIYPGEKLKFPHPTYPSQLKLRGGIPDANRLTMDDVTKIMNYNSGRSARLEGPVNAMRTVMGMSANFSLPKSAVSSTYMFKLLGLQDDQVIAQIIHMQAQADLDSLEDHKRWYEQWRFPPKYFKEARDVFAKHLTDKESEVEAGRKATKFGAWESKQEEPSLVALSKDQILKQVQEGKISWEEAPEKLRAALNIYNIDQSSVESALTSFFKEIEEFKPHDPESAKNMERWVELASMGEKEAGVRREDLLKLNAEVRASVTSWFMKGLPGTTDEESRESMVGGSMWNVVNQLSSSEQNAVWNFLKAQSPFPDSFDSGAFGDSTSVKKLEAPAQAGTSMVTVSYKGKDARPIEIQNYPVTKNEAGEWVALMNVKGGNPTLYDITKIDGQRARQQQLRELLYPQYIIDQILDSEITEAGGTPAP